MSNKEKAYNTGYNNGFLSSDELKELGHTPETYQAHIEDTYGQNRYDSKLLSDQQEFFYGLVDGSNDRVLR